MTDDGNNVVADGSAQVVTKAKNLGLDLLRVWLSFEVVVDHYCHQRGLTGFQGFLSQTRALAVPCFLLMSFYLTAGHFGNDDAKGTWLKTRLGRLGLPYFIWPLIYFLVLLLVVPISKTFAESTAALTELHYYGFDLLVDGWDLVRQYIFGLDRRLVHQFWFHQNLILLTVALWALFRYVRMTPRVRTYLLSSCIMVCLILQYSPINLWLFGRFDFEAKYSFGRLAATLPYAALGLMLGFERRRLAAISGSLRIFLALTGAFLLFFVFYCNGFPRPKGLGYQGINLILMALGTVTFFHYLPCERLSEKVVVVIRLLSRYCMGIYCCHLLVGWLLHAWLFPRFGVAKETLLACVWIWVASWVLCYVVSLLPWRHTKELVV